MKKAGDRTAFEAAVSLLTYRDRSCGELKKRLSEKEYSAEEIEETMNKLIYYGYVDDRSFAESYASCRSASKGNRLIKQELFGKGIDHSVVEQTIAKLDRDEAEDVYRILCERYFHAELGDDRIRRRVYGFFARRGFSGEHILSAMRRFEADRQE